MNLPTSKTGAAARRQAVVLVNNLVAAMNGRLVTSRNRMLAEFGLPALYWNVMLEGRLG